MSRRPGAGVRCSSRPLGCPSTLPRRVGAIRPSGGAIRASRGEEERRPDEPEPGPRSDVDAIAGRGGRRDTRDDDEEHRQRDAHQRSTGDVPSWRRGRQGDDHEHRERGEDVPQGERERRTQNGRRQEDGVGADIGRRHHGRGRTRRTEKDEHPAPGCVVDRDGRTTGQGDRGQNAGHHVRGVAGEERHRTERRGRRRGRRRPVEVQSVRVEGSGEQLQIGHGEAESDGSDGGRRGEAEIGP